MEKRIVCVILLCSSIFCTFCFSFVSAGPGNPPNWWANVTNFSIKAIQGHQYLADLETDNDNVTNITFSLNRNSPSQCDYKGHVFNTTNKNGPVVLRFCYDEVNKIQELKGWFKYQNTKYRLDTKIDGSWILFQESKEENKTQKVDRASIFNPDYQHNKNLPLAKNESILEPSIIEILIVNAYDYYHKYGHSEEKVRVAKMIISNNNCVFGCS